MLETNIFQMTTKQKNVSQNATGSHSEREMEVCSAIHSTKSVPDNEEW